MNYKDIDRLLEEGEGFELEFKRKVPGCEKIARTMVAFANTKGGTILFGVDDDKSVVGVRSEKEEIALISDAAQIYCDPPIDPDIEVVSYKGKDVIVAYVDESATKPHAVVTFGNESGNTRRVFIRVEDNTVEASREVVRVLQSEQPDAPPLRLTIGRIEQSLFEFLEAHRRITVNEFADLVNISKRRASRTLVNLVRAGVIRIHTHEKEDFFTRAFD